MNIAVFLADNISGLKEALKNHETVFFYNLDELRDGLKNQVVDQVILDSDLITDPNELEKLLKQIKSQNKEVLLIADKNENEVLRVTLALGIYNIIWKKYSKADYIAYRIENPASIEDISKILSKEAPEIKIAAKKRDEQERKSKVIAFWSVKNRVGTTSLAIQEALRLAKENSVVLVDFVEALPDVHSYLDMRPINSLALLDDIEQGKIASTINQYLQEKDGLVVLTGVNFKDFSSFKEKHFAAILKALDGQYKHIVIDTSAGFYFSSTYVALKLADVINVVLMPERKFIEDTRDVLLFFENRWKIDSSKFNFILNHVGQKEDLTPEEVRNIWPNLKEQQYSKTLFNRKIKVDEVGQKSFFLRRVANANRPI